MNPYALIIYIFLGLLVFGVGGFWIYLEKSYRCRLRLKELVNNRKIVRDYRVKEHTDKDGVNWWRVAGIKEKQYKLIAAPPEEAIEISNKGKKHAEGYKTQSGDIIWLNDRNTSQELKSGDLKQLEPLTTKQRLIYINNMRKAEARKGLDWKAQLVPIVSIGVLALVVVTGIIFFGEIAKPMISANNQVIQMQEIQRDTLEIMRQIESDVQVIDDKVDKVGEKAPD